MDKNKYPNQKPDLDLGVLQMWVHGRKYPESGDYWDGNWLNVTAHCGGEDSNVWVTGSIIHLTDLKTLQADLEKLCSSLNGAAVLETMEPNFGIDFEASPQKEIHVKVHLTPNHLSQEHHYFFKVSQYELQKFMQEIKIILESNPIIGKP